MDSIGEEHHEIGTSLCVCVYEVFIFMATVKILLSKVDLILGNTGKNLGKIVGTSRT